ncbi:MAG: glycosyltransferase family 2 protein [Bacteroidota bacterium]
MDYLKKTRSLFRKAIDYIDDRYVLSRIRHVHGKKPWHLPENEFHVVTLVRNGEAYMREFIEYYIRLGARHIFIIDNRSDDRTGEIAREYDCVSVYATSLNFSSHETKIRKCFLQYRFRLSWVLCVDIDEHFDFPGADDISMREFIDYLNTRKFTAVNACMLDMFSDGAGPATGQPFRLAYPYVNVGAIDKAAYSVDWLVRGNTVPTGIGIYKNGIRKKALQTDHEFLLVKHPLLYISPEIIPYTHPHYCAHARIADVSCALLHYKFTAGFLERARQIASDPRTHPTWAKENALYVEHFSRNEYLSEPESAYRYISATDLADREFLHVSAAYLEYLKGRAPSRFQTLACAV